MQTHDAALRRPNVLGAHSLDCLTLRVPDLAEAQAFYAAFGLRTLAHAGGLGLHTDGHAKRWIDLVEGPDKRLGHLSFGIFEDDLPAFHARLRDRGIEMPPPEGRDSNALWLRDPDGTPIELRVSERTAPSVKAPFAVASAPAGIQGAAFRNTAPATRPRRLGHVALFTTDVGRSIRFYEEVVGLRLSDRSGEGVAFLHGVHGSDHHMIALVASNGPGLHHCSWEVGSVDEVGLGAAAMARDGHAAGWGMGRHVLGSNYFHYVRDPWGSYSEYSADMDYIPVDCDWRAGDHAMENSMSLWGPAPPPDFVTNYEAA